MKLAGIDGSSLELTIDGYQFPYLPSSGLSRDWDLNWLVVRGDLVLADGRTHHFVDPSLTTWEASEFADWLRSVRDSQRRPTPRIPPALDFTEPNLAFRLEDSGDGFVVLRVFLSLESEPPYVVHGAAGFGENYVRFTITEPLLDSAIAEWTTELQSYPAR